MTANIPAPIKSREDLLIARRAAGLSQAQLADAMGLTQHTISRIETGQTPFGRNHACHAALLFDKLGAAPAGDTRAIAPAKPAGRPYVPPPLSPTMPRRWQFRSMAGDPLTGVQATALPDGAEYQRIEEVYGASRPPVWKVCVRDSPHAITDTPMRLVDRASTEPSEGL